MNQVADKPRTRWTEDQNGLERLKGSLGDRGKPVLRVLLLHGGQIPHYRVPVYNHLSHYLAERSFALTVTSEQIQPGNATPVQFEFVPMHMSARTIARLVWRGKFDVVIMFVDLRHLYLFPVYLAVKGILRRKMVWWGQGRDLAKPNAILKNAAYATEHALCDAIILYAEHLKKYVAHRFHHKILHCQQYTGVNLSWSRSWQQGKGSTVIQHSYPEEHYLHGALSKTQESGPIVSCHATDEPARRRSDSRRSGHRRSAGEC